MTVARTEAIRRRDRLEALNAAARGQRLSETLTEEASREHAESLLRGIDALTRKFAALGPLSLNVLDRYGRILQAAEVNLLLRVSDLSDVELVEPDA